MPLTYRHVQHTIYLPEVVRLKCDKCGRRGQYSRQRYLEICGLDTGHLLTFARAVGCQTAIKQGLDEYRDRCRIVHDWTLEELERISRGERP